MIYEVEYKDTDNKTRFIRIEANLEPAVKPEDSKILFKAVKKQNRRLSVIKHVKETPYVLPVL
jgi:hypothetical protein